MESYGSKLKILIVFRFSLLACFALSGFGLAIENPVGSATTVASSVRSGLVRSVNPINSTSGLVVTGNVGGGKHFRGVVPYNAISDFGGTLGSSSLDSFLRRSGSGYYGIYTGRPTPYYSQTGTVTITRAGRSGVIRPPTTEMGGRAAGRFTPGAQLRQQVGTDYERAVSFRRLRGLELGAAPEPVGDFWGSPAMSRKMGTRPMSMSLQEMEKMILAEADAYQQSRKLAAEQFQAEREQFQQRLGQVGEKAAELKKGLTGRDEPLGFSTTGAVSWEAAQPFELQRPAEKDEEDKRLDVYEQMEQQVDTQLPSSTGIEQPTSSVRERGATVADEIQEGEESYEAGGYREGRLSGVSLSIARAKRILGSHESFADFSKDKFNQYILAGESYLEHGRYYRAADAYTLALVYRPEDPLAYAGKGHALFAAGEYMSSALFVSRALEIFPGLLFCRTGQSEVPPEYARFKIDIEAMVGDRDKLENRIVDVEQLLSRKGRLPAEASESGELEFLLGYVYCQIGRFERAKTAIEAAYEKMPEAPAVIALKQAIDGVASEEPSVK